MRKLVLMRGLPGSGKSTWAKDRAAYHFEEEDGRSAVICSTDDYYMVDGKYVFQPEHLSSYHFLNQKRVKHYMELFTELIIVDNTNIKRKDMQQYIDYAEEFGYEVQEIIIGEDKLFPDMDGNPHPLEDYIDMCARRNTHGVPRESIEKMARRFER